jgi:hypothetical protein
MRLFSLAEKIEDAAKGTCFRNCLIANKSLLFLNVGLSVLTFDISFKIDVISVSLKTSSITIYPSVKYCS